MARRTIVIIGHGSRKEESNAHFEELVRRFAERHPDEIVKPAYIELARPSMHEVLQEVAKESDEVVVIPLLLFRAGHAKNDIPLLLAEIRKKYPAVKFNSTDVLGLHSGMIELLAIRAGEILDLKDEKIKKTGIVLIGRGSSDPDANSDFQKLLRLFEKKQNFLKVLPAYISICSPRIPETLDFMARIRPERILVIPHILFAGVLNQRIQGMIKEFNKEYPWIKTLLAGPLGPHPKLFDVMEARMNEALEGSHLAVAHKIK